MLNLLAALEWTNQKMIIFQQLDFSGKVRQKSEYPFSIKYHQNNLKMVASTRSSKEIPVHYLADRLFRIMSTGVLPAWLAIIIAPTNPYTPKIVKLVAVLVSIIYIFSIAKASGDMQFSSFQSLKGVRGLFRGMNDFGINGAW